MTTLIFTVTNDLNYDQRMFRICDSLARSGYKVMLVGRHRPSSPPLQHSTFIQKRIRCFFDKGLGFYAEYNIRLFFWLLLNPANGICAIDLDTILPVFFVTAIKRIPRIYDAHELFCEMKEIAERPRIHSIWKWIEKRTVPRFKLGYTVNQPIADEFKAMYNVNYEVIRSISRLRTHDPSGQREQFILYQGAVNEGRCFETLIPAMQKVDARLIICGDGNFMKQAKALVKSHQLEEKVIFKGMVAPDALRLLTQSARIGITLFEKSAKSNYYSLANRFFDYIHAGTPQLCVNYPVYEEMNKLHKVSVLIDNTDINTIADRLNELLNNDTEWQKLHQQCQQAALEWCWQNEEIKLLKFYQTIFER